MTDKIKNDLLCSYGSYVYIKGMAETIREKECKNPATKVFENYLYSEKYYSLEVKQTSSYGP